MKPTTRQLELPDVSRLVKELEQQIPLIRESLLRTFTESLRGECKSRAMDFQLVGCDFAIGTALLSVDWSREEAILTFARTVVAQRLPLAASECVDQAMAIQSQVNEPVSLAKTREKFEEAMRVALARKNKQARGELRVELPQLFRELIFVQQLAGGAAAAAYTMPRFVTELFHLVKSEDNLNTSRPFRLETAVLENTKDSRRSVFIPKNLNRSFDEGTYFQAIILRGE